MAEKPMKEARLTKAQKKWEPEWRSWVTHPGDHIAEYIETMGISQAEAARRLGMTAKHLSTIINKKASVIAFTAIKLERVFPIKAEIWMGLQANWDLFRLRKYRRNGRAALKQGA